MEEVLAVLEPEVEEVLSEPEEEEVLALELAGPVSIQ